MTRATSMLEAAEVMCRHDNEMWKWGVRDKAVISLPSRYRTSCWKLDDACVA